MNRSTHLQPLLSYPLGLIYVGRKSSEGREQHSREREHKLWKRPNLMGLYNAACLLKACPHTTQSLSPYHHSSVQFSLSVMSDCLLPHGLQHARPPCPSSTSWVYSNSCPLSQWCHPTISSSVIPFSSHLQSFPASGSFLVSPLFTSGD